MSDLDLELRDARAAVAHGQSVRKVHARNSAKGTQQREADLKLALKRIKEAMAPLRSRIGRFPYGPQGEKAQEDQSLIRAVSQELQRERRKLWKMQKR